MKKLAGILTALILFLSVSSFALDEGTVTAKIKSSFEKTFESASDVTWTNSDGFYFVKFRINDQVLEAAFDEEGQLLGASRFIALSQLPLNIELALKNQYAGYTLGESVNELTTDGQASYYISAENSKHRLTIKAGPSGVLTVTKKAKIK